MSQNILERKEFKWIKSSGMQQRRRKTQFPGSTDAAPGSKDPSISDLTLRGIFGNDKDLIPGLCCCTSCSLFQGADGGQKGEMPPSAKHRALPTASLHPCPAACCLPPLPALAEAPSLSTPHPSSWICWWPTPHSRAPSVSRENDDK